MSQVIVKLWLFSFSNMTILVNFLINPAVWVFLGLLFLWYKKWSKWYVIPFSIFCYALTTPFLLWFLAAKLEWIYEPIQFAELDTSQTYHIVVLGAGIGHDSRLSPLQELESNVLGRLCEGIKAMNQLPNSILITSGNSYSGEPQAIVLKKAAIELGVDSSRIVYQDWPRTTAQEAHAYFERFGNRTPVILATSAIHIPRAAMLFHKKQIKVIAAPCNYLYKKDNLIYGYHFIPSLEYFGRLKSCLHEVLGYLKDSFVDYKPLTPTP
jgi:uncharacterized SAM-binding protein YcdF (DUF218 family)